jgi:isopentenyl phosphate kinase
LLRAVSSSLFYVFTGAQLIPALCVDEAGRLSSLFENDRPKSDATGGISLKLDCAIDIVRGNNGNVKVFLCSLNNNAFIDACLHGALQGNSRCTVINFQQTDSVCG